MINVVAQVAQLAQVLIFVLNKHQNGVWMERWPVWWYQKYFSTLSDSVACTGHILQGKAPFASVLSQVGIQMVLSRCELLLGNGNYQLVLYYFIGLDGEPV